MSVNTLVTENIERNVRDEEGRLPVLTAGIAIFGLSLLCWAPLLLPVFSYLHH
jgi:hypothetical protein